MIGKMIRYFEFLRPREEYEARVVDKILIRGKDISEHRSTQQYSVTAYLVCRVGQDPSYPADSGRVKQFVVIISPLQITAIII